jgi:hypothetical protein
LDKSSKENLANDIEHQLDNFFDEGESSDPLGAEPVALEKLKSLVLSIDWEITESCLTDLIDETDTLLPQFQDDRFSHTLLRMLKAVGRYIRRRQAQSHPDAIKRIMSVFASLEKLTGSRIWKRRPERESSQKRSPPLKSSRNRWKSSAERPARPQRHRKPNAGMWHAISSNRP